ncbi:MAG: Sua5/YciO/YrdC/YwlC family protein [bacterium]
MVIGEIRAGQAPASIVIEVVKRLERGEVLILPTDTVYGLHALSRNREAVERIRKIKGTAEDRALSTIYSTVVGIGRFVQLPEGVYKRKILEGWPGPVTWVLPAQPMMPKHNLGPDGTIGIRIPNNQFLRSICAALDDLVVSTSANLQGQKPPITREDIDPQLIDAADACVFQEGSLVGRPSEVKRWTPGGTEVIRTRTEQTSTSERLHVLFVCRGNTCRSPMAEGLLRELSAESMPGRITVRSAGIDAESNMRANLYAVEALRPRGIDIHQHHTRPVTPELLEWADIVLVMTDQQLDDIHEQFPEARGKTTMLSAYPDGNVAESENIIDPAGGNQDIYKNTADHLEKEIRRLLPHLKQDLENR